MSQAYSVKITRYWPLFGAFMDFDSVQLNIQPSPHLVNKATRKNIRQHIQMATASSLAVDSLRLQINLRGERSDHCTFFSELSITYHARRDLLPHCQISLPERELLIKFCFSRFTMLPIRLDDDNQLCRSEVGTRKEFTLANQCNYICRGNMCHGSFIIPQPSSSEKVVTTTKVSY